MTRPDWDTYFLDIALAVSARGDCSRTRHGCVLVRNSRIIGGGYNGSPPGDDRSCLKGDCPRSNRGGGESYEDCIALHAERNAVTHTHDRSQLAGSTAYLAGHSESQGRGRLHLPCRNCDDLLTEVGVERVVCRADDGVVRELSQSGFGLVWPR